MKQCNGKMSLPRLMMREMRHSRWNTLACVLVIAVATALYVAVLDIGAASVDATRVLMKEMGFNLQITPAASDPGQLQALDFEGPDMPESYVNQLAANQTILAQHFVGKLQHTLTLNGRTAVLTGVLGQTVRAHTTKDPMPTSYVVPQGQAFLGAAIARSLGLEAGAELTILGRPFEIGKVLPEYGAIPEDIRIFAHLRDVQELLNRPGRINAIDALACQCPAEAKDIVTMVRQSIESTLSDVRVQPYYSILLARHHQRVLMHRIQLAVMMGALAAAAAAIGGLSYQNVSARRHEIGVLSALGLSQSQILALFLGKAAIYALPAAALGCLLGRFFSLQAMEDANPAVLSSTADLAWLLPITMAAAMVFSLPAIMSKLLRDPADILGETLP